MNIKIFKLSITLNNVDNQIQENQKEMQTLTENNEALQLRVDTLTRNNKDKDKQIKDLKEENLSLRQSLSFWKDKFLKIISFIKDKLFGKEKEQENNANDKQEKKAKGGRARIKRGENAELNANVAEKFLSEAEKEEA